jgi:transcription elongation factor Elf1
MITAIQKLANKISCPSCGTNNSLTAVLICERGEGKCKTECQCSSCDAKLIIDIPEGLSESQLLNQQKTTTLTCDMTTQVCELTNLETKRAA